MSITFQASTSKTTVVKQPCTFTGCCAAERCGYCVDGVEEDFVNEASVNFANTNAINLGRLLEIPGLCESEPDFCGTIPASMVGTLRQRIMLAKNSPTNRAHLVDEPSETPGGWAGVRLEKVDNVVTIVRMGPKIINCGNTDEQTIRRLEALDKVLAWAQINNDSIEWG